MNPVAHNLKELRNKKGLTFFQLAIRSGMPPSSISHLENGVRKNPRLSTLQKLAKALDVKVEDLIRHPREAA